MVSVDTRLASNEVFGPDWNNTILTDSASGTRVKRRFSDMAANLD
jgi:hypothetical protein